MSASMTQAQALSLKMQEETTKLVQKQGIVSILGCEQSERNRATTNPNSLRLRRTLSADMSSKKWVSQNGFTPMKRIASSEDLSPSNEEPGQSDIWTSIQRDKNKDQEGCFDIWSCIVSNKSSSSSPSSVLPTYVHPLVKRSQSSLSDKSLEICTESLGSETGSDVVSSYPQSETEEDEHKQEHEEQEVTVEANEAEKDEKKKEEEEGYTNTTSSSAKKFSSARSSSSSSSFPPPLPSLSRQDGPSLHMRSRRDHGRLVLEAVSLLSQNNFCAQRQDGRLVLTFANQEEEETEEEDETEETEEAEKTEETEQVKRIVTTSNSGNTSVALMMRNKRNWSEKLNQVVDVDVDVNVVKRPRVARLISSAPSMASATSFNVYEYYWRTKNTTGGSTTKGRTSSSSSSSSSLTLQQSYNNNGGCSSSKVIVSGGMNPQQVVVLRGKNGDYLVHNLKTCKDSRRSFLFLEPYCIATS